MSFFNLDIPNDYSSRFKKLLADDIYQKNPITGLFERVGTGGSGPVELPYYLKSNTIDIDSGTNGSELSATGLTIADSTGNYTLDKTKLKILDNLKTDVMDPALGLNYGPFLVGYSKNLNLFQRISSFTLGNNTTQTNISDQIVVVINGSKRVNLLSDGMRLTNFPDTYTMDEPCFKSATQIRDNIITPSVGTHYNGRFLVSYDKNTDTFDRTSEFYLGNSTQNSYVGSGGVTFKNGLNTSSLNAYFLSFSGSSGNLSINYNSVVTLNNLYNPALITPGASNKMIVFNPTTKVYNYAVIPSSPTVPTIYQTSFNSTNTPWMSINPVSKSVSFVGVAPADKIIRNYTLATGETLICNLTQTGNSTTYLWSNRWYAVRLGTNNNSIYDFSVTAYNGPNDASDASSPQFTVDTRKLTVDHTDVSTVIKSNTYFFRITNLVEKAWVSPNNPQEYYLSIRPSDFITGVLTIKCIHDGVGTLPTLTPT